MTSFSTWEMINLLVLLHLHEHLTGYSAIGPHYIPRLNIALKLQLPLQKVFANVKHHIVLRV